jgi:hypothetical protein
MPLDTRDRDPQWGAGFRMSTEEREAERLRKEAAARDAYAADTRRIAAGAQGLAGEPDAPVDKLKQAMAEPARDPAQDLLDLIAKAEVKGHPVSYDTTYNFGRNDPPGFDKPVSQMSFDELDRFQTGLRKSAGNSPAGKYQVNQATQRDLRNQLGLKGDDIYSPEVQERMGRKRLEQAQFDDFVAGRISEDTFRQRMHDAWPSIPLKGDRSLKGQPLGATDAEVEAILSKVRPVNGASGQTRR